MMKVLWLCNIVLPDFCDFYGFRKNPVGGWMTGMLYQLENKAEIAFCFPIKDKIYMKDGVYKQHKIYSFQFYNSVYQPDVKDRMKEVLRDFAPDVIHIWGTEYPHTLAMVHAAEELGMADRIVIHIQGLVSVYAQHYYADIPEHYRSMRSGGFPTIEEEQRDFEHRGRYEMEAIKRVRHVFGRTDWDEACVKRINPEVNYHFCNEILKEEFYRHVDEWEYDRCEKHTIFLSQAVYPLKGFHYFIKAVPYIVRRYPDLKVFVAGDSPAIKNKDGELKPYGVLVEKLMEECQTLNRITFLGMLSEKEMIQQYLRANVFLSASSIENSSNSICEAALLGCPVISSYVGGVQNLITHGVNGYLYQGNAEYMIAHYIDKVFQEKKLGFDKKIESLLRPKKNADTAYSVYQSMLSA